MRIDFVLCVFFYRDEGAPGGDGGHSSGDVIETNWDECVETFDAMELREELLRGIYAYGFEKPSAIQQVSAPCFTHTHVYDSYITGQKKKRVLCGTLQSPKGAAFLVSNDLRAGEGLGAT